MQYKLYVPYSIYYQSYKQPVNVYILPENTDIKTYLPLIRKSFRGKWYLSVTRRTIIAGKSIRLTLKDYSFIKKFQITPVYSSQTKTKKNIITDLSPYYNVFEKRHIPFFSKRFLRYLPVIFNGQLKRKSVLLYVIDLYKPLNNILYQTKLFSLLYLAYRYPEITKQLPDDIILTILQSNKVKYIKIIENGNYDKQTILKALSYIRRFLSQVSEKAQVNNVDIVANKLYAFAKDKNIKLDVEKVSKVITNSSPSVIHKDAKITLAKVLDLIVVERNIDSIKDLDKAVKNISDIIEYEEINVVPENNAITKVTKQAPLPTPITNSVFKYDDYKLKQQTELLHELLQTFEASPLNIKILRIERQPLEVKENELQPTHGEIWKITVDINDKTQTISVVVPTPLKDGSYLIHGNRYIVTKQIYPIPITFPKKCTGRFSSFTVSWLIRKLKQKTQIQIAGYNLPLPVVLCYYFGFEEVAEKLSLEYQLTHDNKQNKDLLLFKIKDYNILVPSDSKPIHIDFLNGLTKFKGIDKLESKPLSHEFFKEFLIAYTGEPKVIDKLDFTLKIALDKVSKKILAEKGFPTNLFDIFIYMYKNTFECVQDDRNDLKTAVLRSNDIITHIVFDTIKSNLYKYYYKVGKDSKARININPQETLTNIVTSPSLQLMEYVNPIEEISNYYKVTYSGYKGIPKESVSDQVRAIHKSHFGVIDPTAVPLGSSIGVVQTLTANQILTENGSILSKDVSDKLGNEILSLTTQLIPFVSRNEPTRTAMSANQLKQAVLLKNPDIPIVQTGLESVLANLMTSNVFISKSDCDGTVTNVSKTSIEVKCFDGKIKHYDITPKKGRSGQGYSSLVIQKPVVKKGQKVKQGQILTQSNAFKDGIYSYGKNLVTTYMFWKGHTYEDGVVISRSVVDKFTSIHEVTYKFFFNDEMMLTHVSDNLQKGASVKAGEVLLKGNGSKIAELVDLGLVDETSILTYGNKFICTVPYDGKIKDVKVYISGKTQIIDNVKDLLNRFNVTKTGSYLYKGQKFDGIFIEVTFVFEKPLEMGDKLTNRAASKGVICLIEDEKEMPVLPDGRRVEIILLPLTFINRTNTSQLFELYVGEIAYQLSVLMQKLSRNKFVEVLKNILQLEDKLYGPKLVRYLSTCSDTEYKQIVKLAKENRGLPIVIPQFNEPSYHNILQVMKYLKIPDRYKLRLSDGSTVYQPAGMQYIFKLEHMSSHKLFSRSIGPYQSLTGQPTQGKARGGGQRLGEQDVWSLLSWDAKNLVKEWLTAASDDYRLKQKMYRQIIETGSTSLTNLQTDEAETKTKQVIINYLRGMMLDI